MQKKILADIVLYNGKIVTLNNRSDIRESVVVKDGEIVFTGTNREGMEWCGPDTRKINLKSHTVIPGLIDSHCHLDEASVTELSHKIPDVHTLAELISWIRSEAAVKNPGEWIIHPKFFSTRLKEMRWPSLEELDSAAPENPVFLDGTFGGMINSAAMKISGITQHTGHSGLIKDNRNDHLTGMISNSAFGLLKGLPAIHWSAEEKQEALVQMMHLYNSVGITSVCLGEGDPAMLERYIRLKKENRLTLRIFQNINIPGAGKYPVESLRETIKGWGIKTGTGDEWIKVGALKTWMDGGILTGTAWLREPWGDQAKKIYGFDDPNYRGILNLGEDDLVKLISLANELDWKLAVHATGGGAVDIYLNAYEKVFNRTPLTDKRFSIVHGNFFTPEAIERIIKLGIYLDMQPAWFFKDGNMVRQILGEERTRTFHPYRSLLTAGAMVNGGSDHMVKTDPATSINPYHPFMAIASLVTRKTERGMVITPDEAISREEALRIYTINNAAASFEENLKGSIEEGKLADLAVLSEDILSCPEEEIKNISVLFTMTGGKIVYDTKDLINS